MVAYSQIKAGMSLSHTIPVIALHPPVNEINYSPILLAPIAIHFYHPSKKQGMVLLVSFLQKKKVVSFSQETGTRGRVATERAKHGLSVSAASSLAGYRLARSTWNGSAFCAPAPCGEGGGGGRALFRSQFPTN